MNNSAAHTKLVKDILEVCNVFGHFAIPMKVGAAMVQRANGKKYPLRFGLKGQADILCLARGRGTVTFIPIWFEAKTGDGKQSAEQISFQVDVERRVHRYYVIRDVREVDAILKKL